MRDRRVVLGRILGVGFVFATLIGCAPAGRQASLPDELNLVERSASVRPGWLDSPPGEDGENYLFVGQSGTRATEGDAGEEALLIVRRRFAEFAGVEVSLLEEVERTAEGKDSEVLDTNVNALSRVSQSATATISRLRIRQWYWERYKATNGWRSNKTAFRCWALVAVPKDELHRIQAQQEARPWLDDKPETEEIRLEIKAGQHAGLIFRAGEDIPLSVSADHDCYLLLIYQDAAGNLVQVLPNRRSPDGFFSAGQAFCIPGTNDGFAFTVTEPFGREAFGCFAASQRFSSLPGRGQLDGTRLLRNDIAWILKRLRVHGNLPGMTYGEAWTMITTAPQTDTAGDTPLNKEKEAQG